MGTSKLGGNGGGLIARSLALGLASGMRSSLGFNAPGLRGLRAERFTKANTMRLVGIGGELIGDKLPKTPSRLAPPGLAARFAAGAAGAWQLASRAGAAPKTRLAAVVVGVGAAAGGSYGGAAWRRAAAASAGGRPDWQGAVAEDAVALTLAVAASR
jgi:uncharacterized membrane protein